MIILDKKSYSLLDYLVHHYEPETITEISKAINQSRRKIYYHLERINEALPDDVEAVVSYPRIGIVLNDKQREECQTLLGELDGYSYVMNAEERIQLNLLYIAITKDKVTIEKLMQLSDVSRNTVLNDLNGIREKISQDDYDIQLCVNKSRGYYLSCHPLAKIQYLYSLLYKIYADGSSGFMEIVRRRIIDLSETERFFSQDVKDYLHKRLSSAQEILGKKINTQDRKFMVRILPFLILSYRNIEMTQNEEEQITKDFEVLWNRVEYQLAVSISDGLREYFSLELDTIEISIITMLLLSFRKDSDIHIDSHEFDDMRGTINEFLEILEGKYGLIFEHREILINQLLAHCKAMIYRKTYAIVSVNLLTEDIKTHYKQLFDITKDCVSILEKAWNIQLNDDDIAYIVIHLGGEIEKQRVLKKERPKVVLVCNEGVSVQKLLLKQCQVYLSNCDIEAIFTSEQFESVSDIMEADVVISTSDDLETSFSLINVHPILSDDDILKLIHFSKRSGCDEESHFSKELDKCLQAYIPDHNDRYVIKAQIEKLVGQELS